MAHDVEKNGWNINSKDVAEKSSSKDDFNPDSLFIMFHSCVSYKVLGQVYWTRVVKKAGIKPDKSGCSDIEFEIERACLGVEWIPGHAVEADELGLIHARPRCLTVLGGHL